VLSLLGMTILVRTGGDPAAMVRPVRAEILKLDPTLAVFNVDSLSSHVSRAFLVPRLCAVLFGVFGLIGLVLAAVGLFGVVSYEAATESWESPWGGGHPGRRQGGKGGARALRRTRSTP